MLLTLTPKPSNRSLRDLDQILILRVLQRPAEVRRDFLEAELPVDPCRQPEAVLREEPAVPHQLHADDLDSN